MFHGSAHAVSPNVASKVPAHRHRNPAEQITRRRPLAALDQLGGRVLDLVRDALEAAGLEE
jgi:hypothetical protein